MHVVRSTIVDAPVEKVWAVLRDFDGWTIEAIAPEPGLEVNGRPTRRCRLQPDDVITIGPFDLRLVLPVSSSGNRAQRIPVRLAG